MAKVNGVRGEAVSDTEVLFPFLEHLKEPTKNKIYKIEGKWLKREIICPFYNLRINKQLDVHDYKQNKIKIQVVFKLKKF
ncbi:hypothetical protein BpHYR1_029901 [Brachionus plicatilis]|uniref:Uncharacterized protein n=1 Tax=Brachionus plicatilis TaxID=10195 RepID=A0A3M7PLG5_BRAPC|nr:hypothetical protein BpHYR1_029901 [Brachionus plicatilis]